MLNYLADLGHNLLTLSSDVYPLGIANIASYAGTHQVGGPNYPLVEEVRASFLCTFDAVDVYKYGPTYEGERAFLELLQRYGEVRHSSEGLLEAPVPGNHYKYDEEQAFTASVGPEVRSPIETKVETFGEHPAGLGKFTRTLFARDLRRGLTETPSSAISHA